MPERRHLVNPGARNPAQRAAFIKKRPPRACPCGCGNIGMCAEHLERLAQIRESLKGKGMHALRSEHRKVKRGPTCGLVSCMNPRPKGARYCDDCEAQFEEAA